MSGIYLHFSPDHRTKKDEKNFSDGLVAHAVRLEKDRLDSFMTGNCSGIAVHHGVLRSAGLSQWKSDKYRLILCGSCWLEEDSEMLATPDEVLKHLIQSGFNEMPSLRGCYSFAFFDLMSARLIVETDLFGTYPIYYCQPDSSHLLASSEIKALTKFVRKGVKLEALAEMLHLGYIASDLTFIDGIFRLPPGHRLNMENGHLSLKKLSRPYFYRNQPVDQRLLIKLRDSFELAIARYMNDSKDVCVSLSGGLDSRIAAAAAKDLGFDVRALCMGEPGSLECRIAGEYASKCRIPMDVHTYDGSDFSKWFKQAVWVTEGRCHPGHMHFLDGMLKRTFRPNLMLHGLIGDVVIGGDLDLHTHAFKNINAAEQCCRDSMTSFVYWPGKSLQEICSHELLYHIDNVKSRLFHYITKHIDFDGSYSGYLWFRYYYRMFGFIIPCLSSQIAPWSDPIFPYIDNDFFNICTSIDINHISDRQLQINWALKYYPIVAAVPRVKDGVLLSLTAPDPFSYSAAYKSLERKNYLKYMICRLSGGKINFRQIESYPYYDRWYRKWSSVRSMFNDILLSRTCLDRGLWNEGGLRKLMKDLEVGRNGWNALSTILLIEMCLRQFHDETDKGESTL